MTYDYSSRYDVYKVKERAERCQEWSHLKPSNPLTNGSIGPVHEKEMPMVQFGPYKWPRRLRYISVDIYVCNDF